MAHSVQQHLAVAPDAYDAEIRRFIPGYEALLDEAVSALAERAPEGRVLDLGTGTGALSHRIASRLPKARLTVLDADPAMLEVARGRLAGHLDRVKFVHGSFNQTLPRCDAAVASLSLHHLPDAASKRAGYRLIFEALSPRGCLISADAFVPAARVLAEPLYARWAAHLISHGDTEQQAYARFEQWATEDRYFGLDEELAFLSEAGFTAVDVRWRAGPVAVVVALKPVF